MWIDNLGLISHATLETLEMVFIACFFAVLFGLPLGVFLFITRHAQLFQKPIVNKTLGFFVNMLRSIPFIILLVAIIPFTRLLVGTSIGINAAIALSEAIVIGALQGTVGAIVQAAGVAAENAIALSETGKTLTMAQYDEIVKNPQQELQERLKKLANIIG